MAKKDFRLYCEEEYIDHLKMVADEKGTSVNQLVLSVLTKKYPMPKKKKDQTSTGPILDIEATKKHYEALNQFLTENGFIYIKKSGTANVYLLNPEIMWKSWSNNMKYCEFPANVIITESEQEAEKTAMQEHFQKVMSLKD